MSRTADACMAYADEAYAAALSDFGAPVHLAGSGGWLLDRAVPGTGHRDLVGPYPLFSCADWSALGEDLSRIGESRVSVVLVADPLGTPDPHLLRSAFPDRVTVFKWHQVRDLDRPVQLPVHHRRQIRRAAGAVEVDVCVEPLQQLDEWVDLYSGLVARHGISGMAAFSRASFEQQLSVRGMVVLRARRAGETVAMTLWLTAGDRAYYHLGASSPAGYEVSASYALFVAAFELLGARGVRRVDLGGAAGAQQRDDGLYRFKSGWSNARLPAYLCGRVLDKDAYASLSSVADPASTWFPAYRSPGGVSRSQALRADEGEG